MEKSYKTLRDKMSPTARKAAAKKMKELLAEIPQKPLPPKNRQKVKGSPFSDAVIEGRGNGGRGDKSILKGNREDTADQLWATTQEYAATKGIVRRTVQDLIKTGKIEAEIRKSGKKKGAKGSGFEVLIQDAADIEKILRLRAAQKANPKPRNKNKAIDRLKKKLVGANGEISELKKEVAEKEALLSGINKDLKKCRDKSADLIKRYDKERESLKTDLEKARSNADESVTEMHKKELEEEGKKLVDMSLAVKERDKEIDKLNGVILRLRDNVTAIEGAAKASTMARMDISAYTEKQLKKDRERYSVLRGKLEKEVEKLYQLKQVDIKDTGKTLKGIADGLKELIRQIPE